MIFTPKLTNKLDIFSMDVFSFFRCFLFLPAGLLGCVGADTRGRCVDS